MIYLENLLLLIAFTAGSLCVWSDIRNNIVPNKVILAGFIAAGCLQAVYCIFSQREFIIHWVIVMALADIISLAMYFSDIWAAGDAKLFCFLYFCVPCRFIDVDSINIFGKLFFYI